MQVERPNRDNVVEEDGCVINRGDSFVLLREPTAQELQGLFSEFERRFTFFMRKLMLMKYSTVLRDYGSLNLSGNKSEGRAEVPFGALTRNGGKLVNLEEVAVTRGLVRVGAVPALTARGAPTVKLRKGWGKAAEILEKLSPDRQADVVSTLIDSGDVDDYFLFDQASSAAWADLRVRVAALTDREVTSFLDEIAVTFTRLLSAERGKLDVKSKGARYVYAPIWFGQFLACQGIWLFPMKILSGVRDMYTKRLMPLAAWLSVPEHSFDVAEEVLRLSKHKKSKLVLNVFVTTALCSDMWQSRRFSAAPLIEMKYWIKEQPSADHRSSACNELYYLLCRTFKLDLNARPEKAIFGSSKRLNNPGSSFRWCFKPTPLNTRFVSKLIGTNVTSVPQHVRSWAREFDEMMQLFQVQDMKGMRYNFTCWLAYLLTLSEADAPTSLRDVDPQRHGRPYADFISRATSEYKAMIAEKSLSALKRAWDHDAKRGGYINAKPNPFGFPIEKTRGSSPDPSGRESIPEKIWAILVRLNYQNDYGFARGRDIYWPRVQNPETRVYEDVFFGLEAKVVDVVLMTGFRLVDVRWLDSGEGDEFVLDLSTMEEVVNPLPCAIKGRRQGVFQRFWIDGEDARYELGTLRIRDKSQRAKFHAFMDDRIARMLRELIDMQAFYYPLGHPIAFIDDKSREEHTNENLYPDGFPIFRKVQKYHLVAVSEDRVRGYWLAFCHWAQPLLDKELGYHFPLIINGLTRFKLHDPRVTAVTHHLDRGESLDTVRMIVGHENDRTTLHYYAGKMDAVHHAAMTRESDRRRLEKPFEDAVGSVISDGYKPPHIDGHVGLEVGERLFREGRTASFEEFAHGLCPGGKCSEGGPIVAGKPTSVWRPMACSRCRFRLTGPLYVHGVARKANRLLWERDDSFARENKMNLEMEKLGLSATAGRALGSDVKGEILLRDNLLQDITAEIETHQGLLVLQKTLNALNADAGSSVLVTVSPESDLSNTSYSLMTTHSFIRLFGILNPIVMPKEAIHVPEGIRSEFRSVAGRMMRRVGLDKLMIGTDDVQQGALAMAFAEATIKSLNINEIAALADGDLEEIAFPALAAVVEEMRQSSVQLIGSR